jgi:TolA-binding protein
MAGTSPLAGAQRRVLIFTVAGVIVSLLIVGVIAKLSHDPAEDLWRRSASLLAEGRQAEAKPLLELLLRDYPNSEHAARARDLLGGGPIPPRAGESAADRLFREARNFYPLGAGSRDDVLEAVTRYRIVVDSFPQEPVAREALYEMAQGLDQLGRYEESIKAWRKFESEFPTDGRAPEALYALGFIHYNQLGDAEMGRAYFNDLMRRYPASNAADAARVALGLSATDTGLPESIAPGEAPAVASGRPSIDHTPGGL